MPSRPGRQRQRRGRCRLGTLPDDAQVGEVAGVWMNPTSAERPILPM
jgi:hypothetical protein